MRSDRNRSRRLPFVVRGLTIALIATMATGCNTEDTGAAPKIMTVPAKGKVTVAGTPVTEGIITLEPLVDGGSVTQAMGEVKSDGTFEVRSAGGFEGATPGKYRVKLESEATKARKKRTEEVTVEVKEGQELNINLP